MKKKAVFSKSLLALVLTFMMFCTSIVVAADPSQTTVEGNGFYFSTGESYPTKIQIAGYNSRDKKIYLNLELTTTKTSITDLAKFTYTAEIFNNSGELIGDVGVAPHPAETTTATGTPPVKVASVVNKEISLSSDKALTAEHRIIITIKQVENSL